MAVVAGTVAGSGAGCTYEVRPGAAAAPLGVGYHRREPEKTALYRLVRENLAKFLSEAMERSADGYGLPRYVVNEFEKYLACGDLRLGFARVVCRDCRHEASSRPEVIATLQANLFRSAALADFNAQFGPALKPSAGQDN